ncbi:peptidoglycan editing factor PgeF [Thermanaeromonas sp. C210]|uniref:peptidoglycan editing factor PgeF n=1 Tax=Thermanaeromonas sp. C210 TaxID=2731925 RepID=UPI00155B6BB0|nr:peptidoglycan editing factor PgeF [Thermanaeromonas sp. C210]GFN24062.1 laccase domain protein [Thermanaeromonas sp. C210]
MLELVPGSVPYFRLSSLEEQAPVRAAFSTRQGGVSPGVFRSLNLGFHVGDEPDLVLTNRRLFAEATGLPLATWVVGEQVHGSRVAVAGKKDRGRGADTLETCVPGVDALVTAEPGITLVALFADCVPVYVVSADGRAMALIHAGWKGTLSRVAGAAVDCLAEVFNVRTAECRAVIGPAIGPCCYRVGDEVAEAFRKQLPWGEAVLRPGGEGSWYLDLWEANRLALVDAGLHPERIAVAGLCTACHQELFYSYRRDGGRTGRMAAVLGRREG